MGGDLTSSNEWPVPGSEDLIAAVAAALPGFVHRLVERHVRLDELDCRERNLDDDVEDVAMLVVTGIDAALRDALARPADEQRLGPLQVIREGLEPVTRLLTDMRVPVPARDDFSVRAFPGDVYGLVPSSFRDIDESLHDVGIAWGAAKAWLHLEKRRAMSDESIE